MIGLVNKLSYNILSSPIITFYELKYIFKLIKIFFIMGTNLESCKKLTTDVTEIMGSSTFMGKVEPGKHWLNRKSKKVS